MKKNYITAFDGLRAVGVLAVIAYHLYPQTVQGGYLGVVLFFVLSGYLITDLLSREYRKNQTIDLKGFYLRRFKRLMPLLVTVFLVTSLYLTAFQPNMLNQMRMSFVSALLSFYNWWQIAKGGSYFANLMAEAPFKHVYSLAIEAQFYMIWPVILLLAFKLIKRRSLLIFSLLLISILSGLEMALLYQPGQDPTRVYYGTDTRLFSLLIGASAALAFPSQDQRLAKLVRARQKGLNRLFLLAMLLMLASLIYLSGQSDVIYRGGMFSFSLLSALLIVLSTQANLYLTRFLSNPLFRYLGERSYGLYLWQMPVFTLFELKFPGATGSWLVLLELILLLGLTEIFYRLVEKPARSVKWQSFKEKGRVFFATPATIGKAVGISSFYTLAFIGIFAMIGIFQAPDLSYAQETIAAQLSQNQTKEKLGQASMSQETIETLSQQYEVSSQVFVQEEPIAIVGDSMIAMTYDHLRQAFPTAYIDGIIGRSGEHGVPMLEETLAQIPDAKKVVISLGINTDGPVILNRNTIDQMMSVLADKEVYWMTINLSQSQYTWTDQVNAELQAASQTYDNFHLIDWYQATIGQESAYLAEDMTHPNQAGQVLYTKMILEALAQ